jgi:hypothetical protein
MVGQVIRIDALPDDVLLDIFDSYVVEHSHHDTKTGVEAWHLLVHVCRRWRSLVFGSPSRLNLRLYCTPETPSRDTLDVWPALPLIIKSNMNSSSCVDNIIAALWHGNRVSEVDLLEAGRQMEKVLAAMQVPFPELTVLRLVSFGGATSRVDSFLGGSAPHLRLFKVSNIPFPGLPKLLFSATHLSRLVLSGIPHSGYFSPEAMVTLLSVLSSLEGLTLGFESPQSRPDLDSRRPPPLKRSIIPSLTEFYFKGVSEYLEDLVTCIDAPRLSNLDIIFFNQIDFDTPRLAQFINRTPTFRAPDKAHVQFDRCDVDIKITYRTHESGHAISRIEISCRELDWQLSSIAQICSSSLPPLSMVEDLHVERKYHWPWLQVWKNNAIENNLWMELLLPFPAVKSLYLAEEFVAGIAAALQELVGGRITEVLPSLRNIFVRGLEPREPFREHIREFIAARQLSGHPVATYVRNEKGKEIALLPFVLPTAETVEN